MSTPMNEAGHTPDDGGPAKALPNQMIRYCPECGSIGPVEPPALTCCPDSFGMSIRRWQAEKLERMLDQLRTEIDRARATGSPQ